MNPLSHISFRPGAPSFWRRFAVLCLGAAQIASAAAAAPRIFEWERGFGLQVPGEASADMFLWFYEHNLFDAVQRGHNTKGTYKLDRRIDSAGTEAVVDSPLLHLTMRAVANGAELTLRITNRTDYEWPEIAGIIPCWSPGQVPGTNPSMPLPLNRNFADFWRNRTFFLTAGGLAPLSSRAIHFNAAFRAAVGQASDAGKFTFSNRWPTSVDNAVAGLIVRESEDDRWVTGIAWERYVSVQGHNPWSCMHACVRVGPLKPGGSRTIRGRLYLFHGTKEDCLAQFLRDFPNPGG